MLEKLLVSNFQAHSSLKIEFDPNINCIIGPSDVGKSAIIRVLKWICRNSPQGDAFIRDGESETKAQLVVDGISVGRKRTKSKNLYYMGSEEYKAFGTKVPDTISRHLCIEDINFQNQFESPYWFSESAGEVSRQLNAIVDLGIIDSSLSNIGKKVRHLANSAQISEERLSGFLEKKVELDWVVEADAHLTRIADIDQKKTDTYRSKAALSQTRENVRNQKAILSTASKRLVAVKKVGKACQEAIKVSRRRESLIELVGSITDLTIISDRVVPDVLVIGDIVDKHVDVKSRIDLLRKRIAAIANLSVDAARPVPDILVIKDIVDEHTNTKQFIFDLKVQLKTNKALVKELVNYRHSNTVAQQDLKKATANGCPVCGKPMDKM